MNDVQQQFGTVSRQYDSQRKYLIPCLQDFYTACFPFVKSVPHARTVLDLGAGTGLFSHYLRQFKPDLHFTLADFSDEMLDVARQRFEGDENVAYLKMDICGDEIPGKYDVIISGLAIHHLADCDKQRLYSKVYSALNDGGLFINADQVAGKNMLFDSLYKYYWRENVSHSGLDHDALIQAFERTKLDKLSPLEDQLAMLHQAGFTEADCIYKNLNFAVFGGFKEVEIETAVI